MNRKPLAVAAMLLASGCAAGATAPPVAPTSAGEPLPPSSSVVRSATPTTGASPTSTDAKPATSSSVGTVPDPDLLAGISMTSVPPDVIVPTTEASLDKRTNPINGRRGGHHPLAEGLDCRDGASQGCLTATLDALGFDVTSGPSTERDRRLERATAVVQLDAGLPVTGQPDSALRTYVGLVGDPAAEHRAAEVRQIGTSAQERPILAIRYGDGPRTVVVVGQTHGDEEGGLRVLLRARSLPLPPGITLWVVPTMNPDGSALDTRFLADGADPNRQAPSQPEQRAVVDFALDVKPSLTIWYHQNYGWVGGSGASMAPAQRYQRLTGLGVLHRSGDCGRGFVWCPVDEALGSSSILVELSDVLTPAEVQAHALALLAVASGSVG